MFEVWNHRIIVPSLFSQGMHLYSDVSELAHLNKLWGVLVEFCLRRSAGCSRLTLDVSKTEWTEGRVGRLQRLAMSMATRI